MVRERKLTRDEWLLTVYAAAYRHSLKSKVNKGITDGILAVHCGRRDYIGYDDGGLYRGRVDEIGILSSAPLVRMPTRCAEIMVLAMFPDERKVMFW